MKRRIRMMVEQQTRIRRSLRTRRMRREEKQGEILLARSTLRKLRMFPTLEQTKNSWKKPRTTPSNWQIMSALNKLE